MLALMALIGVTFATFSGQSRISARNFAQSVNQPQRDELMDYALSQLISDTPDLRSAIRGHSMARDMYGSDANFNGYLASRPDGQYGPRDNDPYFYIVGYRGRGHDLQPVDQLPPGRPDVLRLQLHALDDAGLYQAVGAAGYVDQADPVIRHPSVPTAGSTPRPPPPRSSG